MTIDCVHMCWWINLEFADENAKNRKKNATSDETLPVRGGGVGASNSARPGSAPASMFVENSNTEGFIRERRHSSGGTTRRPPTRAATWTTTTMRPASTCPTALWRRGDPAEATIGATSVTNKKKHAQARPGQARPGQASRALVYECS